MTPNSSSPTALQIYSYAPPITKPNRKMERSLRSSLPRSRTAAMTSASPHTTLKGPHTRLERLIQTPAVTRQNSVSTTSPRKAPMTKSQTRSPKLRAFSF